MCSGTRRSRAAAFSASSSSHDGNCPPASRIGSSTRTQARVSRTASRSLASIGLRRWPIGTPWQCISAA